MRFNVFNHALHTLHDRRKIHLSGSAHQSEFLGPSDIGHNAATANQSLARHTTGMQAISPHFVLLNQNSLSLRTCSDNGSNQASRTATDHNNIRIKRFWPGILLDQLFALQSVYDCPSYQRKHAKQGQ